MTVKRKVGRPKSNTIGKTVRLTPERWAKAKKLGEGRSTKGIAKALDSVKEDL